MSVEIASLDLTPYQTSPLLTTEATLTLSLDLERAKPPEAPPHVHKAATRMIGTAKQIQHALVEKVANSGAAQGMDMAFDLVVDRLWGAGRRRLEYWMIYALDGLDLLDDAEQQEIDIDHKRDKAELARELDKQLFGEDGLGFLRRPFNQQVTAMGSRLRFITESPKRLEYEELLGPELVETLEVLQDRYAEMVYERSIRDDSVANLRTLRSTLQRHITLYASSVISMIDEDDPQSLELVLAALRPMVNARLRRSRGVEGEGEGEVSDEPEVEADADAVAPPVEPLETLESAAG